VVFKILIFPKNNETNNTKKKQKYFFNFWARQGLTLVLRILITNEKSGLRSSLGEMIWKTIEKMIWTWQGLALLLRISQWRIKDHVVLKKKFVGKCWYFVFLKFYIFLYFSITRKCVTTRTVGQTLKKKENIFDILKMSVTRCERPDRHNKVKENF